MSSFTRSRGPLAALAAAFNGDLAPGGARALIPAPGHSAADRSIALAVIGGRVLVHSFGSADWRDVLDLLRDQGWIDRENRLRGAGAGAPEAARASPSATARRAVASALWAAGSRLRPGSPAHRYLSARAIDPAAARAEALRSHPATPAALYRQAGPRWPALLAAIDDADGALTAVEVTYLDGAGLRRTTLDPNRKIIGAVPAGSAVRLAPLAADFLVGEGVCTTLSAMTRFGLPGWALLSTSNLRRWSPPDGVRRLLIAADRGPDGERSAGLLRARARNAGVTADIVLPPAGAGDWNDLAQEEARRKGG